MEILLAIIFIAFGILQIVLSFKLWGMTNDVPNMKEQLGQNNYIKEAKLSYLKGDMAKTKELLDSYFFSKLIRCSQ